MNFPIQKLELHLNEPALLGGEAIYAAGGVKQLFELERHLWLAEVDGETKFEVEVKISPSKVLAATCECETFLNSKECEHFAAVLFKLRNYLTALKIKKQRSREPKRLKRKLTTNVILEQVSQEDLVSFVRDYAKGNRNFALALKAKFAAQVSQITTIDKYLQLLDSIINMVRRPDRSISTRGVQKINKVLEELLSQVGDNIARENYIEALSQIRSIIEKVTPILKKSVDEKLLLNHALRAAFDQLRLLIQQPIPPALFNIIWDYCGTESKKLTYRSNYMDVVFFELMLCIAKEKLKLEQLVGHIDDQIDRYKKEGREFSKLILVKVQVLDKAGKRKAIKALVTKNLANPSVLFYAIEQYRKRKDYKRANQLAINGLKAAEDKTVIGQLEDTLLQIAEEQGDRETILDFAERRMLATLDPIYFFKLKEYYQGNWSVKVSALIQAIQRLPYTIEKRDIIAFIYKEEAQLEALMAYLQKVASIDLLKEFGPYLIKVYRKETFNLYQNLLNLYLRNHLGRKPSLKIRAVIVKLLQEGETKLAEALVEEFRIAYPERHSLIEELEVF